MKRIFSAVWLSAALLAFVSGCGQKPPPPPPPDHPQPQKADQPEQPKAPTPPAQDKPKDHPAH